MWSTEDSDDKKTFSTNHLFGPQFSAQAQYHVNYGYAVIGSMLKAKEKSEDHGVATCTQPCTTDEIRCRSIACTITTNHLGKKDLLTKSFSNLPPKTLL